MNSEIKANDDLLVARLARNDRSAFQAIFEKYWAPLYGKAYQRLQDDASAKDAVQNVFTTLWHRRRDADIQHLRSYLYGAVRYQVFKQISQSHKHTAFFDPFEMMMVSPIRTDQNLIRDDLAQLLLAWIDTLPRKRRQIFVMHYQEQLTVSEIAAKLGITRKTVYNQLSTCINELQWKLAKYYIILMVIGWQLMG